MQSMVPADANGIQSASLSILSLGCGYRGGRDRHRLRQRDQTRHAEGHGARAGRTWTTTVFNLPAKVLQLWTSRKVTIFLDIDWDTGRQPRDPAQLDSVGELYGGRGAARGRGTRFERRPFRCWSPVCPVISIRSRGRTGTSRSASIPNVWNYEGDPYHSVQRLGEPRLKARLPVLVGPCRTSTRSTSRTRTSLSATIPSVDHEGVAFYAYPDGHQPAARNRYTASGPTS